MHNQENVGELLARRDHHVESLKEVGKDVKASGRRLSNRLPKQEGLGSSGAQEVPSGQQELQMVCINPFKTHLACLTELGMLAPLAQLLTL